MVETLLTFTFCAILLIAIPVIISLEYYYTKTKVSAVSSLPWMRKAVLKVLKEQRHNHKHESFKIYELGSGWGPLVMDAASAFPEAKITGLEFSPVPAWFSMVRAKLFGHKNVRIHIGDFYNQDLSEADVILIYMLESILLKLKPKFETELKPGCIIISNSFEIKGWKPVHVETVMDKVFSLKVYCYRVPESFSPSTI